MKKKQVANTKAKKNKYLNQITEQDVIAILEKCGYSLCENLTDKMGEPLPAIERLEKQIMVRCIAPNKENKYLKEFYNEIYSSNPQLAYKLFATKSMLTSFNETFSSFFNDIDILFIGEYIAYFPFELDDDSPKSSFINQAYLTYCAEKFGEDYVNDYVNFRKKVLSAKNTEKETEKQDEEL